MLNTIKLKKILFCLGLIMTICGMSVLGFFGVRKIVRLVRLHQLMKENVVIEISDLSIKAPVLEGTDQETLRKGAGHFRERGN